VAARGKESGAQHHVGERRQVLTRTRLLLADDHPLLLEKVAGLLCSCFEVVGTARTGAELVSEATRLDPDVVVADVSMPVLSGIEAAHRLREAGSRARFVFLTVHSEEEFTRACMAEGALGYVVKSRIRTDLIPAINAALDGQSYVSRPGAR
jgi:DNA-binding NarL/FixJ family response regulator